MWLKLIDWQRKKDGYTSVCGRQTLWFKLIVISQFLSNSSHIFSVSLWGDFAGLRTSNWVLISVVYVYHLLQNKFVYLIFLFGYVCQSQCPTPLNNKYSCFFILILILIFYSFFLYLCSPCPHFKYKKEYTLKSIISLKTLDEMKERVLSNGDQKLALSLSNWRWNKRKRPIIWKGLIDDDFANS